MAIEEELSLNVGAAIDAIGQMAQSLQETLTGFFVAFDDALKQLGAQGINLPAVIDIEGGQADAFAEQEEIEILANNADASGAASDIESSISDIDPRFVTEVDGDASGLKAEFQDATAVEENPELVVGIALDQEAAQANAEAFKGALEEPVDISIDTAELDAAQSSASGVADALDQTSANASQASENISKGAQETEKAKESADELDGKWQALALGIAQGFVAAVAGAAGAITALAAGAIESESTLVSLQQQLGSLGNELLDIDVDGFDGSLQNLAISLGSSDEAAIQASQKIGLLGQTSGATTEAIKETNSNLVGVAASIRAANPAAGELDEIMGRLTTGLTRGGRAAAGLGISLTSQEIKAKAAIMTGKGLNSQFDQFELLAAGSALAAEQFGDSIQRNIAQASKNPKIALEVLTETFSDALEQFGRPFIAPSLTLAQEFLPLVIDSVRVFARVAEGFVPVIQTLAKAIKPVFTEFLNISDTLVDNLVPAFEDLGEVVALAITGFAPLLELVQSLNLLLVSGLAFAIEAIVSVLQLFGEEIGGAALVMGVLLLNLKKLELAVTAVNKVFVANPYLAAAFAIVTVIGAIKQLNEAPKPFKEIADDAVSAVASILDIPPAIDKFLATIEEYVRLKEIVENADLVSALNDQGISIERFAAAVVGGTEGLRDLVRALLVAGDTELRVFPTEQEALQGARAFAITTENVDDLTEAQLRSAIAFRNAKGAANTVFDEYVRLEGSANATAKALFEQAANAAMLNGVDVEYIRNSSKRTDGTTDYALALEFLNGVTQNAISVQEQQAIASGEAANANRLFAENVSKASALIAAGTLTVENFTNSFNSEGFEAAGFTIQQFEELVKSLSEEMNKFVDGAISRVPTVAGAFKDLGPENTAQSLIDSFNAQIDETNRWNAEMTRLRREGQTDILKVVAELGPQQGLLLLDSYQGQEKILADHLRNMAAAEQAALQATREVAVLNWLEIRGVTGKAAEEVVRELEGKLTLADATETSILEAVDKVRDNQPQLESAFKDVGAGATDALTVGSAEELATKGPELNAAIEAVWSGAGGVAETASRIAAETGVDKFNEIVSSGFLNEETAFNIVGRTTSFFSTTGINVGSAFGEGIRYGTLLQEASVTNTALSILDNAGARAFVRAQSVGRTIGAKMVEAITGYLRAARDFNRVSGVLASVIDDSLNKNIGLANLAGIGIGAAMVDGLTKAIRSGSSAVTGAARQIIADAERAAKDEAESDSPSKVWERLGRDLVSGLSKGLTDSSQNAESAAANVLGRAGAQAPGTAGTSISITVPVTIPNGMNSDDGRMIGRAVGQAAAAELARKVRMEVLVS